MRMAYVLPTVFGAGLSIAGGRMLYMILSGQEGGEPVQVAKGIGITAVGISFLAIVLWRVIRARRSRRDVSS